MNSIKKSMVCMTAGVAVAVASAAPVVSNVSMTQASGGRLVTIKYSLSEDAVVTLDVMTNATPNAATGWTSIGGEAVCNAQGAVWRKVTGADADGEGKYTITWRPDLSWTGEQGKGFKVPDGCAKAVVTAWSLNNTPNYMVVDITSTGGAGTEKYYPAADFVPSGVTNSLYKTGSLLMRKIMAKDVTWMMGSVAEVGRNATRETSHQVTLTNNYYIGIYQVTLTQWQQVAGYTPSKSTEPTQDLPMASVAYVSYTDIRQGKGTASAAASATGGVYPAEPYEDSFLGLLRTKTGLDFDLPSEAQWEFAARAGNGEGYWGNGSKMSIAANKDVNLAKLGRYQYSEDGSGRAIVGSYAPNAWGLYDVHGNVWEWCLDRYADNITDLNGAVKTGPSGNCSQRGGAFSAVAGSCRPAYRAYASPANRSSTDGFRLLCTAGLQ